MKAAITSEDVLDEFDRLVFESIVEKVIVGQEAEDGNIDPFKLTLVLKATNIIDIELKLNELNLTVAESRNIRTICINKVMGGIK